MVGLAVLLDPSTNLGGRLVDRGFALSMSILTYWDPNSSAGKRTLRRR